MRILRNIFLILPIVLLLISSVSAQNYPIVLAKSTIFFSPASGTFLEGSTFDISIYVDTKGSSVNAVEANIKFPSNKLAIVKPSGGKSLIELWVAQPTYSNTAGTASFTGVIPNGANTRSGLITTITFRAIASGQATITLLPNSKVLSHDGVGTETIVDFGRAVFNISPKPPEGPKIFSSTHPFQGQWYNNNNPVLNWEGEAGVTDYSYEIDNKPETVPDNISEAREAISLNKQFADGIWYFHIKAKKSGIWGSTSHFSLRVDTEPPAKFTPETQFLTAALVNRVLLSFFTTDTLSGVDRYEVGVIDKDASPELSPAFVEAASPYQLPNYTATRLTAIVRAIDKAGNVRDEAVDITIPSSFIIAFIKNRLLFSLIFALVATLILHFLIGHKLLRRLEDAYHYFRGTKI